MTAPDDDPAYHAISFRVIRRVLTLSAVLSLMLCIGTAALWLRSYQQHYYLRCTLTNRMRASFDSLHGAFQVTVVRDFEETSLPPEWKWISFEAWQHGQPGGNQEFTDEIEANAEFEPEEDWYWADENSSHIFVGFSGASVVGDYTGGTVPGIPADFRRTYVGVPYWSLLLATAVLPIVRLLLPRLRQQRAARRGLCPICGYDLRATPDRCPECGGSQSTPRPKVSVPI